MKLSLERTFHKKEDSTTFKFAYDDEFKAFLAQYVSESPDTIAGEYADIKYTRPLIKDGVISCIQNSDRREQFKFLIACIFGDEQNLEFETTVPYDELERFSRTFDDLMRYRQTYTLELKRV